MRRADHIPEPPLEPADAWARFPQLDPYEEAFEGAEAFAIDSDKKADWALRKIKAERDELDRLTKLHDSEVAQLDEKLAEAQKRCEGKTSHLLCLLETYFGTVQTRKTKTTEKYRLLNGELVRRRGGINYKMDSTALTAWLKDNNMTALVSVKEAPKWADVKKLLSADPETGVVTLTSTGEVVDGLTAERNPDTFDVKF